MQSNFERAYRWILQHEGGYVNHPKDPGGATNKGVTQKTYDAYRAGLGMPKQSVREIGNPEVRAIYENQYSIPIWFNRLPEGLDYALFDFAVHSGPARAVRFLQRVIGVRADGVMGNITMSALRDKDIEQIIAQLCDDRLAFLRRLKTWRTFGKGWGKRVALVRRRALEMAAGVEVCSIDGVACPGKGYGEQKITATIADNKTAAVGLMGAAGAALEQVAEVKYGILSVFDNVPSWVWLVLVAAMFGALIWRQRRVVEQD